MCIGSLMLDSVSCPRLNLSDPLTSEGHVWLQCYVVYVGVTASRSSECIPELMAYIICILCASQEYQGTACITYDVAFRQQAATTGNKQWSKINLSI